MPQLIDQSPASESAAIASEDANLTHRLTSAWGGVPGECGVECECGVTFDGFDTIAEAEALLSGHISKAAIAHPAWCDPAECWAYENDAAEPPVGGFHQSRELTVDTYRAGIRLHVSQDHGNPAEVAYLEVTIGAADAGNTTHLTLDQAEMLRAALDVLLPSRGFNAGTVKAYELGVKQGERQANERAALKDVGAAFKVGVDVGHIRAQRGAVSADVLDSLQRIQKRLDDAERERYRAYCLGWVDGSDGRAPEFEVNR